MPKVAKPRQKVQCDVCHKMIGKASFKDHERIHKGPTFLCEVPGCQQAFVQREHLKSHNRSKHGVGLLPCAWPGAVGCALLEFSDHHQRLEHYYKVHDKPRPGRKGAARGPRRTPASSQATEEEPNVTPPADQQVPSGEFPSLELPSQVDSRFQHPEPEPEVPPPADEQVYSGEPVSLEPPSEQNSRSYYPDPTGLEFWSPNTAGYVAAVWPPANFTGVPRVPMPAGTIDPMLLHWNIQSSASSGSGDPDMPADHCRQLEEFCAVTPWPRQ